MTATHNPAEEFQKANKKLDLAETELTIAKSELASVKAETLQSPERIAKAELGVAESKLGVAVAKWESAGEGSNKDILKGLMDVARNGVDVAQQAYRNALDATKGKRSLKPHAQNMEPFCAHSASCVQFRLFSASLPALLSVLIALSRM
jgi:hypothetical protein